jgi:hypothetical protein
MQQYFKTGKTIVIDDQYSEAKPLLDALSRNQIPFLYTQGKPNSDFPLPNSNPEDAQYFSLIFLDLNLDFKFAGSQIGNDSDEKTFKGTHAEILNTIVRNKNKSFIVVIWSNEEENFLKYYLQLFDDFKYTQKRPYKIITLNKSKFFTFTQSGYQFNQDEHGDVKPFEKLLFDEINTALADLDSFKLFCEWDRVVSQSVGDTIDDFMNLINNKHTEAEREEHLAEILTSISIAYSGHEGFLQLNTEERTDSVLLALTQILNDDIDRNVLNERQNQFANWKAASLKEIKDLYLKVNTLLLNKKLLIYEPNQKNITGSVFRSKSIPNDFKRIVKDSFEFSNLYKKVTDELKIKYKKRKHESMLDDAYSKAFEDFFLKKCIPIEVNVTPLCDIVQNKFINYRILSGFLAPVNYYACIKKSDLAFFYQSPKYCFGKEEYFIGLDLRSFSSCTKEEINAKEYLYSLRTNIMNEIQTKLAAHVSRLGVLYL